MLLPYCYALGSSKNRFFTSIYACQDVNKQTLIKTDFNGTVVWRHKIIDLENLGKIDGIFVQDDGQISVFSDYADALGDSDVVLFKLDKNGQLNFE